MKNIAVFETHDLMFVLKDSDPDLYKIYMNLDRVDGYERYICYTDGSDRLDYAVSLLNPSCTRLIKRIYFDTFNDLSSWLRRFN